MRRTTVLAVGLCVALSACGTAGGTSGGAATSGATTGDAATAATTAPAAPAPSASGGAGTTTTSATPGAASSSVPAPGAPGPGSCTAELSGAVTARVSRPGGVSSAASSLWFDPAELARSGFAAPGQVAVVVNCDDQAASINLLLAAATPAAAVPPGPGTYRISAGGEPGTFTLLVAVPGDARSWSVVDGEVRFTRHDTRGVTGEFRAHLRGDGSAGAALAVDGRFDYPCVGGARCGR